MGEVKIENKIEELNLEFQSYMGRVLETTDVEVITQSILVMMGQLIQTIMLINFRKDGYLTDVEQGEVVNMIVHYLLKKTYSMTVEQVNETHPEWFEKKKTKH